MQKGFGILMKVFGYKHDSRLKCLIVMFYKNIKYLGFQHKSQYLFHFLNEIEKFDKNIKSNITFTI